MTTQKAGRAGRSSSAKLARPTVSVCVPGYVEGTGACDSEISGAGSGVGVEAATVFGVLGLAGFFGALAGASAAAVFGAALAVDGLAAAAALAASLRCTYARRRFRLMTLLYCLPIGKKLGDRETMQD